MKIESKDKNNSKYPKLYNNEQSSPKLKTHQELRNVILENSKRHMSHVIARNV